MSSDAWGIVIGIDFYPYGVARPGIQYHGLSGAVGDANIVESFLAGSPQIPRHHIYKLTSSKSNDASQTIPLESSNCWPTYENIVNAFQAVTQQAKWGDFVYIHYSGHGGRVKTIFGNIKGDENAFDEALVPFNINVAGGRYIRDVEIATLLHAMVAKGLVVTVVLDSCHSGSSTRNEEALQIRSIPEVDNNVLETDRRNLVTPSSEIINTQKRGATTRNNWLVEPQGYTLLAACKGSERAREIRYPDGKFHGIFTYWLMNTLSLGWTDFTYEMLYNRVRARVYCDNPRQTPVLEGEVNRRFLGLNRVLSFHSATVNHVRDLGRVQVGSVVELNAGNAHLIDIGTEFAICAPPTVTNPYPQSELARVRVKRIRGVVCEAEVSSIFTGVTSLIDVGCSAVLLPTGTNSRKRVVKLHTRLEMPGVYQHMALSQLKTCFTDTAAYFIKLQEHIDGPFDIRIAVNDSMEFECSDSTGHLIPNLLSPIKIFEPDAIAKLVRRITHVAKFCNIRDLENPNRLSTLANTLRIEVVRNLSELERQRVLLQQQNQTFPPNIPNPLQNITSVSEVMNGDVILLHIHNLSAFVVNVTVFDLDSCWQVSQILPINGYFVEVDPGKFIPLTLTMVSEPGLWNSVDIIKAFATVHATSFRWLELPVLDEPHRKSNVGPSNELEELCVALTEERRNQVPPMSAWETVQVAIRVNRAG
jgi:hypothetical protein